MGVYAMLVGNVVQNLIAADDKIETERVLKCVLVEVTSENPAGIGWTFNEETNTFIEPPTTEGEPYEQPA